jgi:hypothetical protein
MERDARGWLAATVAGALMMAGVVAYAVTALDKGEVPLSTPWMGVGIALFAGGLLRRSRGRAIFDPLRLMEVHRQETQRGSTNVLRVLAWAIDVAACAAVAGIVYTLLDEVPPRADSLADWAYGPGAESLKGVDFWRAAVPHFWSSDAQEIFGPFVASLIAGLYLVLPGAVWGGTPMQLAFRLRHLRTDGHRTGALHGALRILGGSLFAPLQIALFVITLVFGSGGRWRNRSTGQTFSGRHRIGEVINARRSIADLICRTETLRLGKSWGRA